jgi:alkanesulfonate monooxygenase SsuD/methylene tetrahydromethanopterin reductase-like flavin-dependent oxidoreductase (luciferase family)
VITTFDSSFAGFVDMENVGYGGTPVNDRRYPNKYLISAYEKAEAIARLMDGLGYDALWLAEHHFQPEGYEVLPNLPMLGLHLSHLTQILRFGCGFNITPMWHPLRLAEDYALADILSGGRVIFGVGRGYHSREVETFGAPLFDQEKNRDLFEEQVEIIMKAFREDSFSFRGRFYDLPPKVPYRGYELEKITLVPRPTKQPVECWQPIQGATPRGLDFMARHGIKGAIGGGVAEGGAMDHVIEAFRDANARAGRELELGEDLSVGFHFYVARTEEEAMREAGPYFEENLKIFGPLRLHRGLTEEQIRDIGDPKRAPFAGLPSIQEASKTGAFLGGPPDLIIEKLMKVGERYPGLRRVNVMQPIGTPKGMMLEQLQRFADEVMPAFQRSKDIALTTKTARA